MKQVHVQCPDADLYSGMGQEWVSQHGREGRRANRSSDVGKPSRFGNPQMDERQWYKDRCQRAAATTTAKSEATEKPNNKHTASSTDECKLANKTARPKLTYHRVLKHLSQAPTGSPPSHTVSQ